MQIRFFIFRTGIILSIYAAIVIFYVLTETIIQPVYLWDQKHFLADKYGAVIDFIDVPELPYSSTDIRKKVAMGLSVKKKIVGEEVEEYIKSRKTLCLRGFIMDNKYIEQLRTHVKDALRTDNMRYQHTSC